METYNNTPNTKLEEAKRAVKKLKAFTFTLLFIFV
jgi:hypothetical protein